MRCYAACLAALVLGAASGASAQIYTYDFGTGSKPAFTAPAGSSSTTFVPVAPSGTSFARVTTASVGDGLQLLDPGDPNLGSGTELSVTASNSGSSTKFSVYNFAGSNLLALSADIKFTGTSGEFVLAYGVQTAAGPPLYSGGNSVSSSTDNITFSALRFKITNALVESGYRNAPGGFGTLGAGSNLATNTVYRFAVYANNSAVSQTYSRDGVVRTLAPDTQDIFLGDQVFTQAKRPIPSGTVLDSFAFYGVNSVDNSGKMVLDDISYAPVLETAVLPQAVDAGEGFRLLGTPVSGATVATLAGLNLVQSVAGQYPDFPNDNLFLDYDGTGASTGYIPAADTTTALTPGKGFFWYLFDRDLTPTAGIFGGGTSRSYTLATRPLSATGTASTTDVAVPFTAVHADGSYLLANPFAQTLLSSGVTQSAGNGTFSDVVQAYDPVAGYQTISRAAAASIATWQGFFAEVQPPATGAVAPTFTYLAASRASTAAPLVSRPAAQTSVALALSGTMATGKTVRDGAATLVFSASASDDWDTGDASKLTPPGAAHALVAVVGTLRGAERRQAVRSLPDAGAQTTVDLAFTATHAGTFALAAPTVPAGWSVVLTDRAANRTADLTAGAYTFTADAGDWATRFSLTVGRTATAGEATPEGGAALGTLFPNPAAGRASLTLRVDAAQTVRATVVDALGRTVATVFEGALPAGSSQTLSVETAGLAPGVYAVRVHGATFTATRRLVVAR